MLKVQRLKLQKIYTADWESANFDSVINTLPENKENTSANYVGAAFIFNEKALSCVKSNEVAFT